MSVVDPLGLGELDGVKASREFGWMWRPVLDREAAHRVARSMSSAYAICLETDAGLGRNFLPLAQPIPLFGRPARIPGAAES